ncbi:MAG: hypothetical protein IJ153_00860 [Clostridia bacterium]|nr:hypothetical protein [Clostridia bacterium]
MYKKQMKLQRVICLCALIVAALVFVYSLGMLTDLYDSLYPMMRNPDNLEETDVPGSIIYYDMQPFNHQLLIASIALILLATLLFITGTSSRRKYYVGNYFATCVNVIAEVAVAVWAHLQIAAFKTQFVTTLDFDALEMWSSIWETPNLTASSTFWFDAHYLVFALVLLAAALLTVNVIWKRRLMRGEQALLAGKAA